ncbi:MAG: ADOP family duplicated permease [Vicinamibacterales bacterium]
MLQDLRYAWRLIKRQPGFSILAIVTLTLGIGAATAIFTVSERVLLRPLPYPDLHRVMRFPSGVSHGPYGVKVSDAEAALPQLSSVGLYDTGGLNLGEEPAPIRLRAAAVTSGFFTTLGVPALLGRTFNAEEDRMMKVAVLSFEAWRRYFASSPTIVGRTVRLNGQPFTVVGVMPPGFSFPAKPEVLVPPESDRQMTGSAFHGKVIGRLASGVTREQFAAALRVLSQRRAHDDAPVPPVNVTPLPELLSASPRPTLLFLASLAGMLLLVACANVAGVLMSRLRVRERELLVRRALGATRARLLQQLLTECLLLTSLAAVAGLTLAYWLVRAFAASDAGFLPDLDLSRIDARFFVIGAALATLATMAFAVVPALSASRAPVGQALRETATPSRAARWFGSTLVVGQVAVAILLVAATASVAGAVARLMRIDLGFNNSGGVIFEITLPYSRYKNGAAVSAFLDQLESRVRTIAGVRHVGASNVAPGGKGVLLAAPLALAGDPKAASAPFIRQGERHVQPAGPRAVFAPILAASPGYFQAVGIRLLAGRTFTHEDGRGGRRAAILSEGAARAIDPDFRALIGRRLARTSREEPAEIVGIVGNVRLWDVKNDATRASYQIYEPVAQAFPRGTIAVAVDASEDTAAVTTAVREALRGLDPELPVYNIERVADLQARYLAPERLTLGLTAAFSTIALMLCAIGLYGVLAQVVSQRSREIGIRMALGADRGRLRRGVVMHGMRLAVAGVLAGTLAAVLAARAAASMVPMIDRPGPWILGADALILIFVAVLAAWVPARRASAVDPAAALRAD